MIRGNQAIQLTLFVGVDDEADAEEVDGVARQLRQELAELPFVEEVDFVQGGPVLEGVKGADALLIGAMTVSFLAGAAPALAGALHRWQQRGDNGLVKLQARMGDRAVRLELPAGTMTPEQLQQIVNTLMGAAVQEIGTQGNSGGLSGTQVSVSPGLAQLGRQLDVHFDLDELKLLCADLGIEWENVAGETRVAKAFALVAFCGRSGQLAALMEMCRRERPGVDWRLEIGD
jgi:hypothetical protein